MRPYGPVNILNNDRGSLVVIAIIILMLLTLIGSNITTTSSIELQIAGNEKLLKTAFYEADGGIEIGAEIIEQNLGCVGNTGGFTADSGSTAVIGDESDEASDLTTGVHIDQLDMWINTTSSEPSDANRDFHYPSGYATGEPHTNFNVGGNTTLSSGAAIQMVAGYEGKGKGAGGGGGYIVYDMYSQRLGVNNSQSMVMVQWRHVIGQEGACNY